MFRVGFYQLKIIIVFDITTKFSLESMVYTETVKSKDK
jgi:hypothetical protein